MKKIFFQKYFLKKYFFKIVWPSCMHWQFVKLPFARISLLYLVTCFYILQEIIGVSGTEQ